MLYTFCKPVPTKASLQRIECSFYSAIDGPNLNGVGGGKSHYSLNGRLTEQVEPTPPGLIIFISKGIGAEFPFCSNRSLKGIEIYGLPGVELSATIFFFANGLCLDFRIWQHFPTMLSTSQKCFQLDILVLRELIWWEGGDC